MPGVPRGWDDLSVAARREAVEIVTDLMLPWSGAAIGVTLTAMPSS
ncbi:MAG: hypothetical protein IT182_14985 [Acidobacteria bacterium]|nr:hypothetical protein [Acidobacteriota bacterium]